MKTHKAIQNLLNENSNLEELEQYHPSDVASELHDCDINEIGSLLSELNKNFAARVVVETHELVRSKLLESCDAELIASWIDSLPTDESAFLISSVSEEKKKDILEAISSEDREEVNEILQYKEDEIGSKMQLETITVSQSMTVTEAIRHIRLELNNESLENYHKAYVINKNKMLLGEIPLLNLIMSNPEDLTSDIMNEVRVEVTPRMEAEEVAQVTLKHNEHSIPVVNEKRVLLGRVTLDDLSSLLQQELEEDMGKMSGTGEENIVESFWVSVKERLPWLLLGLIGGVVLVFLLGTYEGRMQEHPEFVFFIPLIMSMGGSVGIQSSSIIVRGLSSGDVHISDFFPRLSKEISVSFVNGSICSGLILLFGFLFLEKSSIGVLVSVCLFAVMILATVIGVVTPLVLKMFKIEPAYATGPFITIGNDVLGIAIYMNLGKWILDTFYS